MNRPKPKVGDTLFSLNIGNAARRQPQVLSPVEVVSVGTKYFTTKTQGYRLETKYYLDDWREVTNYSPNSQLYATEQEYAEEKEGIDLSNQIRKSFDLWNPRQYKLETLRAVAELLK